MRTCLYCYQLLANEMDFHMACSRRMFGQITPPDLPYSESELEPLAREVIQSQTTVTGVQPKLSLHISRSAKEEPKKFTIVGLWGGYILKPPTFSYPQLPEVEDLTMHLAELAKIKTAPHSLIRLASGNLAYITKRVDRFKNGKLAMEDMCQLTERLTEDKYKGSYEQIARTIRKYSSNKVLDIINLFEIVLFSFLTGNGDMHLKNFSLLEDSSQQMTLSPAYDLVNTALVNPSDTEELALTLNGRKRRIQKTDFQSAMTALKIDERQQENLFSKMRKAIPKWVSFIDHSFLTNDFKIKYKEIIIERAARIYD